jgi:hypothetical protein
MQVFIVGSPLETASALSKRHLNNQINEAKIILDALNGAKAWSNHPCVLQYRGYEEWLRSYKECLEECQEGKSDDSPDGGFYGMRDASRHCEVCKPSFHTQEYYDQMKRRLYTKDKEHYKQWADLGESQENWYCVDGEWRKYVNGKRVK